MKVSAEWDKVDEWWMEELTMKDLKQAKHLIYSFPAAVFTSSSLLFVCYLNISWNARWILMKLAKLIMGCQSNTRVEPIQNGCHCKLNLENKTMNIILEFLDNELKFSVVAIKPILSRAFEQYKMQQFGWKMCQKQFGDNSILLLAKYLLDRIFRKYKLIYLYNWLTFGANSFQGVHHRQLK